MKGIMQMTDKHRTPAGSPSESCRPGNRGNHGEAQPECKGSAAPATSRYVVKSLSEMQAERNAKPSAPGLPGESEAQKGYGRFPVWMAALITSGCRATVAGADRQVQWHCVNGSAHYTNEAPGELLIQPLGIRLESGHTLAVSWRPGETEYAFEVFQQCA